MNKTLHLPKLKNPGFTIIELLVFIVVLAALGLFAVTNIRSARAEDRDSVRKTDLNALAYQLETSYEKNSFYPKELTTTTLKGVDEESLKDSQGLQVNEIGGNYQYKPAKCDAEKCASYELTAQLEKEALYTKKSLR